METVGINEIVKANATALYSDAAQPSVRVLGKTLAQCISLFATPIERTAKIFERNIHRYFDKLENLKEEELVPPESRVLVPILEKFKFIDEEKVAEYYAEILATASKKEHAQKVMVTFIEILNRLSADELMILEFINSPDNSISTDGFKESDLKKYDLFESTKDDKIIHFKGSLPVIDIQKTRQGTNGYLVLKRNFSHVEDKLKLRAPDNLQLYYENMFSLGLLERKHDVAYAFMDIYKHLVGHKKIQELKDALKTGEDIEFEYAKIKLTNMAERLLLIGSGIN